MIPNFGPNRGRNTPAQAAIPEPQAAPLAPLAFLLPALLALFALGWAFTYMAARDTPVGKVEGQVILTDLQRSLGDVEILLQSVDDNSPQRRMRRAVTNAAGRFTLNNVPEGDYNITATARAHGAQDVKLGVVEGKTTFLTLNLARNEPELEIKQHQRVFSTKEAAHLSLSGYVDSARVLARPPLPDTLRVRLYKTRLSAVLNDRQAATALEEVGRSYQPSPVLPPALMKPALAPAPNLLLEKDVAINTADREGFFYQKLDMRRLGMPLSTGLYLLDIRHEKQTVCTWLLVTDTTLIVKRAKSQLVAFVVNMQTGKPVAGSQVRTYRNGSVTASGVTDARGVAQYQVPGVQESQQSDSTRITTVALSGEDEAVVERNAYRDESGGDWVVHAYTDRTVYRPGQRIYFKGIARHKQAESGANNSAPALNAPASPPGLRYAVPANEPVDVEIRDKGGERILQRRYVTNKWGAFAGQADLLKEAATGVYTLVTKIGGSEHTADIYVASYNKPEYAVTVTPDKKFYLRGDTVRMTIEGKYFFGAPVAGAKVHYSVYSSPNWTSNADDDKDDAQDTAPTFSSYRSDSYYGATSKHGDVVLDGSGKAVVEFKAQSNQSSDSSDSDDTKQKDSAAQYEQDEEASPQEEVYTLSATVKEGQDRETEATGEARVTRGAFRLSVASEGYVAAPNQAVNVTITARDFDGNPVPNLPVNLESGYEAWKQDKYEYKKSGAQPAVTDANGRALVLVTPPRNGGLTLKARASDPGRHLVMARTSLWVTSDQPADLDTTYDDLALLADKRHYNVGDTARVLINTAHVGQTVLLTVEGERVQRVETVPITKRSTIIRVPVLAQYGPNVFLSACYVQNKHFAQSSTPLRVLMPQSDLKVTITADREKVEGARGLAPADGKVSPASLNGGAAVSKEGAAMGKEGAASSAPTPLPRYAPRDRITYTILATDAQGKPAVCDLSFGVVDEAIYALREDDPKALRQAFYPRRENAVSTEYSFAVEYLGDADKTEPKIETRKKFPDTAYWNPDLQTDANGRATVSFELPDNLTTWRATATAHTADTQVGRGVEKALVSKDFFVRLQTPRTLTQRDQSRIVAIAHNETGLPQTVLVRLTAENLNVAGDSAQTLTLAPGASGEAVWTATANGYGNAHLKVTAWTPKTPDGRQYTDGLETTLPIRPHGREDEIAFAGDLEGGREVTQTLQLDNAALPGLSRLTLRLTPSVASSLAGGLEYLIGYPYGCVEQTLSRILPDLQVQRALHARGLSLDAAETRRAGEIGLMVREGLARLYRFQHPSGAWGWWEHDADDPWMTGYVLMGLATAKAEGYAVSDGVLANGRKAGLKLLAKCKAREKPFLLYGLALAGERQELLQSRKSLSLPDLSPENLAYVVLMDDSAGQDSREALRLLAERGIMQDSMLHWPAQPTKAGQWNGTSDDQDDLTATAMALRVIVHHDPHDARIAPILRWLMIRRTGEYWGSTRDTAWTLAALSDYLASQPGYASGGQVNVSINGKAWQAVTLTPNNLREKEIVLRVPPDLLHAGKNAVTLSRLGGNSPIFYSAQLRQTVATEDAPAQSPAKIGIEREYLRVSASQASETPWKLRTEPTHNQTQAGERLRVRLTLNVPRDMAYVLIEDPFPAGCEVSERGDASEVTDWNYWWSSVDVRDDCIAFFARSLEKGQHVIEYNLRAQTPGTYHTLPTLLQAMYAPEMKGYSAETKITIGEGAK